MGVLHWESPVAGGLGTIRDTPPSSMAPCRNKTTPPCNTHPGAFFSPSCLPPCWRPAPALRPPPRQPQRRAPSTTAPCSAAISARSEEHTSELQSPCNLVCRLLLEKKKN